MKELFSSDENIPLVNDSILETLEKLKVFDIERYKGGFYIGGMEPDSEEMFLSVEELRKFGNELIQAADDYHQLLENGGT